MKIDHKDRIWFSLFEEIETPFASPKNGTSFWCTMFGWNWPSGLVQRSSGESMILDLNNVWSIFCYYVYMYVPMVKDVNLHLQEHATYINKKRVKIDHLFLRWGWKSNGKVSQTTTKTTDIGQISIRKTYLSFGLARWG